MKLKVFNKKLHYAMVKEWMKDRQHEMPKLSRLPSFGVIVEDVACVFLIKTDAKIAMLDFFMTNPNATLEDRMQAYDLGMEKLQDKADKLGFEVLIASTTIPKVMAVVMRHHLVGDGVPFYFFKKLLPKGLDNVSRDSKPSAESIGAAVSTETQA